MQVKLPVKNGMIDPEKIARDVVKEIGYNRQELEFSSDKFKYLNYLLNSHQIFHKE